MTKIAKCPKCGSTSTRRYIANSIIAGGAYLAGNMAGCFVKLPLSKFGLKAHIEYALGEAGEWVGNALFSKLVCNNCGTTFPKPEDWDSDNRIFG